METKRSRSARNEMSATAVPKKLRSPLLGLRHAMGSPAPRERENSDDSMESPRSYLADDKVASRRSGGFPSIKVDKCDALPPMRQSSEGSETVRKILSSTVSPGSPDGVNSLYVPSPTQQTRSKDGKVVVFTNNLESLKTLSRSEGDLKEAVEKSSTREHKKTRLDASFRPEKFTRPTVHLDYGATKGRVRTMDARRSPPMSRSLRLVPLQQSSRARSDNDLSSI